MTRLIIGSALLIGCSSSTPTSPQPPASTGTTANPRLAEGTHRIPVEGGDLVYHVHGRGPVAIAVPGGPGFTWEYLRMTELEEKLTVVYMEPIGTGASARLPDPAGYSRARDVADLEALRAHLGSPRVFLIGHSYGGFVALEHVVEHPGAWTGVVLYDTSPTTGPDWGKDVDANVATYSDRAWFADATAAFAGLEGAKTDEELSAIFTRIGPFYVRDYEGDRARWDAFFKKARLSVDRSNRGTKTPYDVRARLGEIKVPTLVVVGATDFICSPKMAAIMAGGIPGAKLVTLEGSGHLGHIEEPARFVEAVSAFVEGVP